jgi:hypothetical protein
MLNLLASGGLSGTIPDNAGGGIYVGSIPPSSALTNKVWFAVDSGGKPVNVRMYWNGAWRPIANARLYDIKLYFGPYNGVFDSTGLGIPQGNTVTPYDQEGWAICNGQNNTINLEGYFPCGASWNGSAWVANPEGTGAVGSGGTRAQALIAAAHLPGLHVALDVFGAVGAGCGYNLSDGNDSASGGPCGKSWAPVRNNVNNAVVGPASALPSLRLFFAMAYVQYIGY